MRTLESTATVLVFKVTETLQNGKERRITKKVYSHGILSTEILDKAREMLKEDHYYDISMIDCKYTNSYFVE